MFVERIKDNYNPGLPIFTNDIISLFPEYTRAYVFRLIKKSENNGELVRFSRGAYCIPKKTFFGYSTISANNVANKKYIKDDVSIYGIYSGLTLLNQFGLTTQVPNVLEIVTNNEATRKRIVEIDGMKFIIRKSRFEINNNNYQYYTILQLFLEIGPNQKINDFSKKRIKEYLINNNIDNNVLIKYAMYFPQQVIKTLLESEVLNGTI